MTPETPRKGKTRMDAPEHPFREPDIADQFRDELGPAPECIFCGSSETRWYALFGTLLSTSQVYCTNCRTVFEVLKDGTPFGAEDADC
jgi:hypothetical protein